jgi:hypothetical protein
LSGYGSFSYIGLNNDVIALHIPPGSSGVQTSPKGIGLGKFLFLFHQLGAGRRNGKSADK